jgi:hypothetical protein
MTVYVIKDNNEKPIAATTDEGMIAEILFERAMSQNDLDAVDTGLGTFDFSGASVTEGDVKEIREAGMLTEGDILRLEEEGTIIL